MKMWEMGDLTLVSPQSKLATDLQNDFETQNSELDMLFMTLPDIEPVAFPGIIPVVVQKSGTSHLQTHGICKFQWANTETENHISMVMGYEEYMLDLLPQDFVENKIRTKGISSANLKWLNEWSNSLVIKVTVPPMHGEMVIDDRITRMHPSYSPHKGYVGKDRLEVLVTGKDLEGRAISKKLVYFINVLPQKEMDVVVKKYSASVKKYCGTTKPVWRISLDNTAPVTADSLAAWQRASDLSALLANAGRSLVGLADLASTAVGETTGQGPTAQITLDTNAAGHNWYVDPTPLDNTDDYLPTSDPTVFKAKAGSAAEGKMDMLSVLLHEYGHALGLEHSANGADFMAASLQPGVRKLPTAAELTLMARLVAELKGADGEALTLALSQGERGQDNPSSPLPSPSPLSALGLLPLGFMRRNGNGSANVALATGAAIATHTDYLTAINTTLANGSFSAGQNGTIDQWESVGNVATAPATASQAVTLGESTTAQAHLAQAFVLSAQDRFLTFTVSGLDLQTNSIEQNGVFTAAPQDAFEVALQNANTGANLLANGAGGVGNYPF